MKYRESFDHEKVYEGESYDDVVNRMREQSPFSEETNTEYMASVCGRMGQSTTDDPEEFIKVMLINKFIEFHK